MKPTADEIYEGDLESHIVKVRVWVPPGYDYPANWDYSDLFDLPFVELLEVDGDTRYVLGGD